LRPLEEHRCQQEDEQRVDEVDDDVGQFYRARIEPVVEGDIQVKRELRDDAAVVLREAEILELDLASLCPVDLLDLVELGGIEKQPTRQARRVDDSGQQRSEQDTA
jgi:hypothetical protein